jgi:hypothetical protein
MPNEKESSDSITKRTNKTSDNKIFIVIRVQTRVRLKNIKVGISDVCNIYIRHTKHIDGSATNCIIFS